MTIYFFFPLPRLYPIIIPRSRLIFSSSETSILVRHSQLERQFSGKKSDNNPVLRWGKGGKNATSSRNNFSMGEGEKKLWNLDGTAPVFVSRARLFFCWLASDINVPSLFERNENVWKEEKEEGIRVRSNEMSRNLYIQRWFGNWSPNVSYIIFVENEFIYWKQLFESSCDFSFDTPKQCINDVITHCYRDAHYIIYYKNVHISGITLHDFE